MKHFTQACGLLLVLSSALLLTAYAGRVDEEEHIKAPLQWDPPTWCRDKQCPEFSVAQTAGNVELRRYKAAHWIMVNETQPSWSESYKAGYKKLQDYVGGHNEDHVKLADTNPSLTIFYPADKGRAFQPLYTIEYFVPYDLQSKPPTPSADELDILHVPEQDIWVLTFDGFATEDDVVKRAFDFLEDLERQGHKMDRTWVGFASYDLPVRLVDRHNEIWAWAKAQPSTELFGAAAVGSGGQQSIAGRLYASAGSTVGAVKSGICETYARLFGPSKK